MRILKSVKEYGSQTIGTNAITLDQQNIKALGDVISWALEVNWTCVHSAGTFMADSGGNSAAWRGSNITNLFNQIQIRDSNNTDICYSEKRDLYMMSYLLSLINTDDFIMQRGLNVIPATTTADETNRVDEFIIPQAIAVTDLPATFGFKLGVLTDFFATVSTSTVTINTLTLIVRYVPPKQTAITIRVRAFNITAFSANTDVSHLLPNNVTIHVLAYVSGNLNATSAPAEIDFTRVDNLAFRRGSNEEIENIRRSMIDNYVVQRYNGFRPVGLTVIPTDAFKKTSSSYFYYQVNAQIAPRVFYVYQ